MMSIFFNEKLFSSTSTVSTVSYIPSSHVGYSFLHSCQPLFLSTYYSHLCGYEMVSYHNFGLYFPNNIQKTKIMASSPNTSLQIDGETMETVTDFIFMDSKITADGDGSHEIKRCLLLGIKAMINLDNILKSRDISLSIKVCLIKAMVFPLVIYGCESWTIKKAEH